MGYIQQFANALIANSISSDYDEALSEWVYQGEISKKPNNCICGHPIMQNLIVINRISKAELVIGNCCIRKFGVKREHYNKSRIEYLRYAWGKAKTRAERDFLKSLADAIKRYKHFRLSIKQKEWLERITGVPYRWKQKGW